MPKEEQQQATISTLGTGGADKREEGSGHGDGEKRDGHRTGAGVHLAGKEDGTRCLGQETLLPLHH